MHGQVNRDAAGSAAAPNPPAMQRRARHIRRWCGVGVVAIPSVQALVWSQYTSLVDADGAMLVGDDYCDCRATVAHWVHDYFWTQMIWLPANTLALLVWGALAFTLLGRRFGARRLARP